MGLSPPQRRRERKGEKKKEKTGCAGARGEFFGGMGSRTRPLNSLAGLPASLVPFYLDAL